MRVRASETFEAFHYNEDLEGLRKFMENADCKLVLINTTVYINGIDLYKNDWVLKDSRGHIKIVTNHMFRTRYEEV